jgi:hypothetical protein
MHNLPSKGEFLLVVAVAVFLLFAGTGVYRILYPVRHWIVECVVKDNGGKVLSSRTSGQLEEADQAEDFLVWAQKRGETCNVTAVRQWYALYRPGHPRRRTF